MNVSTHFLVGKSSMCGIWDVRADSDLWVVPLWGLVIRLGFLSLGVFVVLHLTNTIDADARENFFTKQWSWIFKAGVEESINFKPFPNVAWRRLNPLKMTRFTGECFKQYLRTITLKNYFTFFSKRHGGNTKITEHFIVKNIMCLIKLHDEQLHFMWSSKV